WRHGEPERFCGFQVDRQIELRRQLDGDIRLVGSSQNLVHHTRGAAPHIFLIRGIRQQQALAGETIKRTYRWNALIQRKRGDPSSISEQTRCRGEHHTVRSTSPDCRKSVVEILWCIDCDQFHGDAKLLCKRGGSVCLYFRGWVGRRVKQRDPG